MSEAWWSICRRNSTDDPVAGLCPECQHPSLMHPGVHNPNLKACMICALDQADHIGPATLRTFSTLLSQMTAAEIAELGIVEEDA